MKYEQPSIVANGSALACVHITNKPAPYVLELDNKHTMNAYEADE